MEEITPKLMQVVKLNLWMGQSVGFNIGLYHHYESVELENVSVAMAMVNPEKANDTCSGFYTFHTTKVCTSDSYTCKMLQYGG